MCRERKEITVQVLDIDRHVRRRLRAIHDHHGVDPVGGGGERLHVDHRSKHVGHVRGGHDLRALGYQFGGLLHIETAGLRLRDDLEGRARPERQLLPGHDVGVVLHRRNDDLVTRPDVGVTPRIGDEV